MEAHLNESNTLTRQAKVAGIQVTEGMKVQRLLGTLPQSMQSIHHTFRTMDPHEKTWDELTKQFNLCIEDATTWAKRNGKKESGTAMFVGQKTKQNKNNQNKDKGNSRLTKDKRKGKCFTCKTHRLEPRQCNERSIQDNRLHNLPTIQDDKAS
jgi:hypothetical protein